ncbi:MAG: hypothetical protein EAZ19_21870 [Oscillatoriales cyanobacterium]|nr:MAG: hypothetical protein EAZ86_09395 [Oscillatoriales cyanobacterium]TAF88997.1 MAG: hypothetical protein EAZ49_14670 [Oscillatoriales cyanobacterium]TAG06745.1 MAG: hypothetical protein EAZ45_03900 [Oscillatoriales cyanobacterium]TAG17045.1 MAG: hypothetical protein EAZ39_14945 [Oscillatoriales cyanobacterium]TAG45163.1 MAG: hypothetical protein EAZ33_08240 [Oscillatoriales cyanobacterium]
MVIGYLLLVIGYLRFPERSRRVEGLLVICGSLSVVEGSKGYWLLVIGYWLLVIGYWLLVTGYWLLVIGCWLLVICLITNDF